MSETPLEVERGPEAAPASLPVPSRTVPAVVPVKADPRRAAARWLAAAMLGLVLVLWLTSSSFEALPLPAESDVEPSAGAAKLRRKLDTMAPSGHYAVVDSFRNRLRLYRGSELVRDAVCSTGSGLVLKDTGGDREWVFDTPRGERQVVRKTRDPVWIKPDWAFVEEGYLPPEDAAERRDDVSLGDYGIYLGHGYIIHGTLFPSLLGRKVTHGCIRLGDEDLEFTYRKLPVGARVFLY